MSESQVTDFRPPLECQDCGEYANRDHSDQGFGHYKRCCKCYERRQRGEKTTK